MNVRSALLVSVLLLVGCTEKRFACQACLSDDPKTCASSSIPTRKKESEARCSAAEELCNTLVSDSKKFESFCKDKKLSVMLGCSKEDLDQFRIECTAETAINVPLLIDL